eukprot:1154183-Pelagomonas_calceolata.AAC.1
MRKASPSQKQIAKVPHTPATDITAPIPCHSKPKLQLKVADWKSWAYTDRSCRVQDGKTIIGAGVYHPMSDSKNLVEPNGAGITNTTGRAELAAIAATLTHKHTHVATGSLSSLHQLRKQILYPEEHRCHVQGDVLKTISNIACTLHGHIFYKVKSHAGLAGNECAGKIAKYQASRKKRNNKLITNWYRYP